MQVSAQEQVLEILRNPTTNPPDKVKAFSFKLSGGSYAKAVRRDRKTRQLGQHRLDEQDSVPVSPSNRQSLCTLVRGLVTSRLMNQRPGV